MFVQRTIAWEKTPQAYDAGTASIVLIDAAHHFLEITTQLYRERKDASLTVDLKSGYLIRVGTWTRQNPRELVITSHTVDSYKYFQMGAAEPAGGRTEMWRTSGPSFGPVQRILGYGKDDFEPTAYLRNIEAIISFWNRFVLKKE